MKPLAEFHDYDGLRRGLNIVREKRDISLELMNAIAGAPDRYFSKILGPNQNKRLGLHSLGWALGGLGVKCLIVDDPDQLALIQGRFQARDVPHLLSATRMRWGDPVI